MSAVQEGGGGVQLCEVAGEEVLASEQSNILLHARVWEPDDEHAVQSVQLQMSAVQEGDGGVQLCLVLGDGVSASEQSNVLLQARL